MRFGSLFSGIGGFDLGFERVGMSCAWQCEIDQKCQEVLSKQFGVKIYDDVRSITSGNTEPVDLICGGFPCQDVSIAGKRAGLAGERSGLWAEFARIVDELKPGWVVIENVPGLLSSNQGRDFKTVLDQMVKSWYGVCWRVLDAQYFGVAQRRRRVFIVGSLGSGRSAEVLFEREGVRWNPPARGKTGQGIAYATLDNTTAHGARYGHTELANTLENQSTSNMAVVQPLGFDLAQITSKLNYSNPKPGDPQPPINTFAQGMVAYENHPADSRITETGDISQQLTSRMGTGGGNVPLVAHSITFCDSNGTRQDRPNGGLYVKETDQSNTISGQGDGGVLVSGYRMTAFGEYADYDKASAIKQRDWKDATDIVATSWTLRQGKDGGGKGYLGSEELGMTLGGQRQLVGVRRLTPTECERLQGFPDGWTAGQSDSTRYKQLGNAVAVPVAEWIGKRIMECRS